MKYLKKFESIYSMAARIAPEEYSKPVKIKVENDKVEWHNIDHRLGILQTNYLKFIW